MGYLKVFTQTELIHVLKCRGEIVIEKIFTTMSKITKNITSQCVGGSKKATG